MSNLSRKRRRDLAANKWQFLAAGVTVMIGVMMFAATYDSYRNLTESYNATYDRLALADMTVTGGDEDIADQLAAVEGVATVEVRHQADVPVAIDGTTLLGRFIGMPPGDNPAVNAIDVTEGSYLEPAGSAQAIAEVHIAQTYALAPGDTVSVLLGTTTVELDIIGTAESAEYIWVAKSRQEAFTNPEQFGVFFVDEESVAQLPPSVSVRQALVLYEDEVDVKVVDAAVTEAAKAANAADIQTLEDQPSNAALSLDVEGFGQMAIAFPVMFLTAAGLTVYVLLTRIVYAQRSVIGTMRASGMSAKVLRRHYLGYGVWIGLIGSSFGVLIGLAMGSRMTKLYTGLLDIPDTVVDFRPFTAVVGLAFGLAAGTLAAWIPARSAYRNEPAQAMRGIAPALSAGESLAEKVIPPLRSLPVRWRMTMRGIGRAKGRSISTVVGVVLALVLILASGGMIDTIVTLIDEETQEINLQDAIAIAESPVTSDAIETISDVPHVTGAEAVTSLAASVTNNGATYATTLQGFERTTQMHGWTNPSGELPTGGILAGSALRDVLDVSEGDSVRVALTAQDITLDLVIEEFVDESLGTPLYIERSVLESAMLAAGVTDPHAVLSEPTVTSVYVNIDPTVDRSTIITAVEGLPGILAVQDTRTFIDLINENLALFYAFVGIMLVFGGLMAFALMFSTISVNVSERSTEFATLKASGMSDRTIGFLVAGENLFLTALGILPGLLVGTWVADAMMKTYSSDMFSFALVVNPVTYIVSATAMFAVAILSLLPGIRRIRRLNVGEVMRERAV
ncbi:MAG: FtsX-like permease family protein [Actinomycetota bacterium]